MINYENLINLTKSLKSQIMYTIKCLSAVNNPLDKSLNSESPNRLGKIKNETEVNWYVSLFQI